MNIVESLMGSTKGHLHTMQLQIQCLSRKSSRVGTCKKMQALAHGVRRKGRFVVENLASSFHMYVYGDLNWREE